MPAVSCVEVFEGCRGLELDLNRCQVCRTVGRTPACAQGVGQCAVGCSFVCIAWIEVLELAACWSRIAAYVYVIAVHVSCLFGVQVVAVSSEQ